MATIEELMKAVRTLKANGMPAPPAQAQEAKTESAVASPASATAKAAPPPPAQSATSSPQTRQAILDDPKLNGILQAMPGSKIVDIRQGK